MIRKAVTFVAGFSFLLFSQVCVVYAQVVAVEQPLIVMGVLARQPKLVEEAKWQHLVRYLNRSLSGKRVTLRILTLDEIESAATNKQLDMVLTQPAHYVSMTYRDGLSSPIATLIEQCDGLPMDSFGGVIATLPENKNINSLRDLANRKVGVTDSRSLCGSLAQQYELHKAGVLLPDRAQLHSVGTNNEEVIKALLTGEVDVAYMCSGIIESMIKKGVLTAGQLRIINKKEIVGYPFALSTDLYPARAVGAFLHSDKQTVNEVASALLKMPHNGRVAQKIGIHGFEMPADYHIVVAMMRDLHWSPFNRSPNFSINDIWNQYRWMVSAGVVLLFIIVALLALLIRFNRRLNAIRRRAEIGDARLKELSEHVPGMIYQYRQLPDGSSHYPYASKAAHDLFDLDPRDLKRDATPLFSRLHPEDVDEFHKRISESARNMSALMSEYRVILPGGRVYWREGLALPSKQEDGSILWQGFVMDVTDRKQLEEAFAYESDLHMQVLSSLGEGVLGIDLQGRITFVNTKALEMLGWTEKELVGENLYEVAYKRNDADSDNSGASGDMSVLVNDWFVRKNGSRFPVAMLTTALEREGVVWGKVISFRDITRQQAAEAQTLLLVTALEASANAIVITDLDTKIEWVNPAFCAITGYDLKEVIGRKPAELVKSGHHDVVFYEQMWAVLLEGKPWRGELVNRRKDGSLFNEEAIITPVSDALGNVHHYIGVKQDISERKRMEEELRAQASTDMLTGLPNRRSFFDFAEVELARIKRRNETYAVIVMLDLDHFKTVNDTYGHAVGDLVLQQLAVIMRSTLRRGDYPGRLGGEEFVMLLPETSIEQARHIAERLRQQIESSVIETEGGGRFSYTASFGLSAMVESDDSFEMALGRADEAMYRAKDKGRNRVEVAD